MSSKLESEVCYRVALSGESYGGNRRPGGNVMAAYRRVDGLKSACTPGSVPGLTLGNEYGRTLLFYLLWAS